MNYSTFEISALWHWIERLFVYQADSPLMMGSIPFALLFIFFLAIYTLLKSYSRTAMMMYVICFSLFFAYKVNGMDVDAAAYGLHQLCRNSGNETA